VPEGTFVDQELDRFKRMNLAEYADSAGYRLVRREPTRGGGSRGSTTSSLLMRQATTDDKIVIRLDRDGHWTYFSVRDDRDNGTIIDFVLRRGARSIAAVREELRCWAGDLRSSASSLASLSASASASATGDRRIVRAAYDRARSVPNHPYLNVRGIRPETLACRRFAGTWRVDARGDLLFPHRDGPSPNDICGFERKNARFAAFSTGGTKTLWTSNARDGDARLVITEAVIDAFSYHQLQPGDRNRYLSTSGSIGERQARHVSAAIACLPPGSLVVLATDNDDAGEKLAEKIGTLGGVRCERHRPPAGKDWNEWLQRCEREFIRSLGHANLGRSR
jgi:Toprim-like